MQWRTRKHGLSKPLNALQIVSWIVFTTNLLYFSLFIAPMFGLIVGILVELTYVSTGCVVIRYALAAMLINPIDDIVIKERKAREDNVSFCKSDYEFFCSICDCHVSDQAKHCGKCNKCISGFDHHCYWLNNCIGDKNYKSFIKVLVSFLLQETIFVLAIIIGCTVDDQWNTKVEKIVGVEEKVVMIITHSIMGLINLICLLGGMKLMLFHIYIKFKGISTFQYIKSNKDKNYKSRFKIRRDSIERNAEGPSEVEKSNG
ncbi:unnamed protein product [Moneuplotes crassus]|uniref:Palmitoyltransferase n=1 Tax=Euplotes crassus TaxID=5936 RepID=A0AAD1XQ46_EUPCR|nr:unnamed protein product [Moneuplotes crassus]